ncbi:GntR family transcriptional regulator [Microbacterium sp. B2969]|uniref:GntR family transcriptional regulator n=1 Tax=Microbacterium alkaliflavum TaxID=3248839 RepID=A0ABW7Q4K4_9MICO
MSDSEAVRERDLLLAPTVRETANLPRYWELKEHLLAFCEGNRAGTPIPAERRLADEFGISRMTVRQAIQELVIEGRLQRAQGRGTFVAPPKLTHVITLASTSEAMRAQGVTASSRILSLQEKAAPLEVAHRLSLEPGSRVVVLERLRYANSEVMALDYSYFESARFPGLIEKLESGRGVYEILESDYDALPVRADELIEATVASPRVAGLLDTETGAPLLLAQRQGFLADGTPVEWSPTYYRSDRYRFLVQLGL